MDVPTAKTSVRKATGKVTYVIPSCCFNSGEKPQDETEVDVTSIKSLLVVLK